MHDGRVDMPQVEGTKSAPHTIDSTAGTVSCSIQNGQRWMEFYIKQKMLLCWRLLMTSYLVLDKCSPFLLLIVLF